MVLAVRNEADHVEQLIVLTTRLTNLLERETALFQAHRSHEAAELGPEKMQLATLYRLESQKISQNPDLILNAPEGLRESLRQATIAFEEVLLKNGSAIEAARTISEGLVRTIADHVKKTRAAMSGYGANGSLRDDQAGVGIAADRRA